METINFGEHYMLDGYAGDCERLNDCELIVRSMVELSDHLGLHRLSDPHVFYAPDSDGKDPGGWSGFVVLSESHISIHTFPARRFVSIDVYTCKNGIDRERIKKYFKKEFLLKDIEENFVRRGTRYPAHNICETEREMICPTSP